MYHSDIKTVYCCFFIHLYCKCDNTLVNDVGKLYLRRPHATHYDTALLDVDVVFIENHKFVALQFAQTSKRLSKDDMYRTLFKNIGVTIMLFNQKLCI